MTDPEQLRLLEQKLTRLSKAAAMTERLSILKLIDDTLVDLELMMLTDTEESLSPDRAESVKMALQGLAVHIAMKPLPNFDQPNDAPR
jgi:hypothetical protein